VFTHIYVWMHYILTVVVELLTVSVFVNTTLMRYILSSYILYFSRTTTNFFYIFMEYDAQDRFQSLYNKRYNKSFLVAR
jgi:hypothetical protein